MSRCTVVEQSFTEACVLKTGVFCIKYVSVLLLL